MKKIFLLMIMVVILTSGCFKRDDLEDVTIYTTVYPIQYLSNELYGNSANILSIYPAGVNTNEYKLTEKQIKDYSNSAVFIYNGLSEEKKMAANFINRNKSIKIIDASQGIDITYQEELWLSPANYLMLAQNIKNRLKEYITNKYVKEEVDENYNKLKLAISEIDAELKIIAENAPNKYIIVSSNIFKFLEKYGYEVISLEEATNTTLNKVKSLLTDKKVSYIFIKEGDEITDTITNLTNTYKVEVASIKSMTNLTDEEILNKENYVSLMKSNIDLIKAEMYE